MPYSDELVAFKLRKWEKYLNDYRLPQWEEIPDLGLYMEQIIDLLKQYLDYLPPELKEEQFITASTIHNYVRTRVMPQPRKKKYYREHIAYLIMILTLIRGLPDAAMRIASAASGLLSSIQMTPSAFGKSRSTISRPSTISLEWIRISWSLQVR